MEVSSSRQNKKSSRRILVSRSSAGATASDLNFKTLQMKAFPALLCWWLSWKMGTSMAAAYFFPTTFASRKWTKLCLKAPLLMVSTTSRPENSIPTPASKYPTIRGAEVDSRKIIATGAGRQHLTAISLAHILFASEELAQASLHRLRNAEISFEDLAKQISNCLETRERGGAIGWVTLKDENGASNDHLDLIFPSDARDRATQITTKPGDIVMVESSRGYHLVQVVDVMADVRKMAWHKQRRNTPISQGVRVGILGGALSSNQAKDLTYKLETMGCQMNIADSERIEGQLQSLGIRPLQPEEEANINPDVVVLNTCSIRDHAEQKVYSYLGPYSKRKREGEDVAIVVAGCVAQQEGQALLRRVPEIDLVMGPQVRHVIVFTLLLFFALSGR